MLIPDVHQNIWFIRKALESNWDRVVFMGDYLDCAQSWIDGKYIGYKKFLKELVVLIEELGDKATWLVGNHDVSYIGSHIDNWSKRHFPSIHCCSQWSGNKAQQWDRHLSEDWMFNLQLACKVGKYTISHAGIQEGVLVPGEKHLVDERVEYLNDVLWLRTVRSLPCNTDHWISWASKHRGGTSNTPSPVWCDWNLDFKPVEGLNQIVGHTRWPIEEIAETEIRCIEGDDSVNYCIDNTQTTYAVVDVDNDILSIVDI